MTLTKEQEAALVGWVDERPRKLQCIWMVKLGLAYLGPHPERKGESKFMLTPAGQLLAQAVKDRDNWKRSADRTERDRCCVLTELEESKAKRRAEVVAKWKSLARIYRVLAFERACEGFSSKGCEQRERWCLALAKAYRDGRALR